MILRSRTFLDPMPDRVEPALALLKAEPPSNPRYIAELKFDGYRLAIHIEPHGIRILTRGGHDWTARFDAERSSERWKREKQDVIKPPGALTSVTRRPR